MEKMWEVTRRKFLGLLSAAGLLQVSRPAAALAAPRVAPGYKVLSPAQVATLEAMAAQIIPADQDPGAREAGVVHYIDKVLAGYQSEKLPLYAAGLEGADETSRLLYGRNFSKLAAAQQIALLKSLEKGDAPGEIWRSYSSRDFFAMLWGHVLEGFYGPPSEGGNRNYASWKMVGFPEHSGTL